MEIKIHRGLEQIGGCITEIRTTTSRVFIDMGQNLPGCGSPDRKDDRPFIDKIFNENKREHEAVLYTHGHEDHIGLMDFVPEKEVRQYVGEGTKELLELKYKLIVKMHLMARDNGWTSYNEKDLKLTAIKRRRLAKFDIWPRSGRPKSINIGDIKITPFFNCHSIYDSYMFLIEADGKRIWHTGDYRAHGYMGKGLFKTLNVYAKNIDVLITEGTMLNREDKCIHEAVVAKKMAAVISAFKYVFVLASSTDIERLASVQAAAKEAHSPFYASSSMFTGAMEIFTKREGDKVKGGLFKFESKLYSQVSQVNSLKRTGFTMVTSVNHFDKIMELKQQLPESETLLIYSSWPGYYTIPEQIAVNPKYKQFREMFINCVDIHTSGHADRQTIEKVIKTVNAKEVIVIHKEKDAKL